MVCGTRFWKTDSVGLNLVGLQQILILFINLSLFSAIIYTGFPILIVCDLCANSQGMVLKWFRVRYL